VALRNAWRADSRRTSKTGPELPIGFRRGLISPAGSGGRPWSRLAQTPRAKIGLVLPEPRPRTRDRGAAATGGDRM
jgi:hypothetical protein